MIGIVAVGLERRRRRPDSDAALDAAMSSTAVVFSWRRLGSSIHRTRWCRHNEWRGSRTIDYTSENLVGNERAGVLHRSKSLERLPKFG